MKAHKLLLIALAFVLTASVETVVTPTDAHAGVLIRGISRVNVRAPRANFQRVQSTSSVIKATNPTFKTAPTSNPQIAAESRAQKQYYQQMQQWYRKRLQYDRKMAQIQKRKEKEALREADRRRRMLARSTHGVAGAPVAALDSVATDPREWFSRKIAGHAPAPAPVVAAKPAPAAAAGAKTPETAPTADKQGHELKGVQKKPELGIWFHVKRALGLI